MKIFIWIGCMLIPSVASMLAKDNGIILGGIPTMLLYGGAVFLAEKLCERVDKKRLMREVSKSGMTINEYTLHGLDEAYIANLSQLTYTERREELRAKVRKKEITKYQYNLIMELDWGALKKKANMDKLHPEEDENTPHDKEI